MRALFSTLAVSAIVLAGAAARAQDEPPPMKVVDAPPKAPEGDKPKEGAIVTAPGPDFERVADEGGQIYVTRGYKGVVPGVRDESAVPSKAPPKELTDAPPVVEWVGFQPFATYSRVFVQVQGRYAFMVTKPQPNLIEVRVPDSTIASANDLRHLVTRLFPTAIDQIHIVAPHDGVAAVVVRIFLKKPVGYLYRSEGKYVFVDVEL
jgi:hypothetical protein